MDVARNLYAAAASHGMKEAKARLEALGPAPAAAAVGAGMAPQDPAPGPAESGDLRPGPALICLREALSESVNGSLYWAGNSN